MRAAIYVRISTADKDQNPDTQLLPLRDFCAAQHWEVAGEYVDKAPARDLLHRTAWRKLLADAAKRRFNVVLVWKLDRAFRSVKDMHDTLAAWELVNVEFQSVRERFDTSTAIGRLLMTMLASIAEFELELIRERVKAGMERARRQGIKLGRPRVTSRGEVVKRLPAVLDEIAAGSISKRQAAKQLKIGYGTLSRLVQNGGAPALPGPPEK